ncbi:MAG: Gfo/Idh/MocA family oxidoreductase [Clostridia bacterium]|nr:Gfo/Idh/MocA family oxidoreductase [Clostridia bacterium]
MKNVRFGIIGVGNMGSSHAACLFADKIEGAVLTALCDIDENRRNILSEKYPNVVIFADYKEMISSGIVDAVIVATPHPLHSEISVFAMENGVDVLCEKPADITAEKAALSAEIAKKTGKKYAIMFNQRTNPLFKEAKRIVESGEIGNPTRLAWIVTNWYRTQNYYDNGDWRATWSGEGGGVLMNQAPHNLDLWQWIFGMPERIFATCSYGKYHNIEVEDEATILAKYKNGATATFITSTGEYPGTNRLEIIGSKGKLVIEQGKLKKWILPSDERTFCFNHPFPTVDFEPEYSEIVQTEQESGHRGILQNFTDSILKNEPLISPGSDGIFELLISNSAYISADKGEWIELPFDAKEYTNFLSSKVSDVQKKSSKSSIKFHDFYSNRWKVNW